MIERLNSLAFAAAILFGVFGLVLTYIARDVDRWPRRLCIAILSTAVASAALEVLATPVYPVSPPFYRAIYLVDTLLAPLPSLLVFAYFLDCCGEDYRRSKVMRVLWALGAAMVAAGIAAQFSGEIDAAPEGTARFGFWLVLSLFLSLVISVVCFAALIRRRKKLTNVQRVMFCACFLTSPSIKIILVELYLMAGLVRRYQEQKEETVRQRTQVAVLQMRPHFIHNTLMSIYYLCARDPQKAQQVILDFSRYLQSNFTAIAREGTIPFSEELEHTRAYLAVEQARFQGQLFVEFDTPDTFFRIPALTLQPIVENAIKHGVDPDLEPLYVTVATEDTDMGVRITVEDTGPGYAPSDADAPHFALDNIRERLKTMCGGTLELEPREAGGTKVTLFVPRREHGRMSNPKL
ncbi:MAG: histidine kinase [Oscillospiraceae bacterium]|nr:histidine kinase [Oscillospiraceae bacterium]